MEMATPGRDGPAEVLALGGDGVEGRRRPQVDHDAGTAVEVVGADGVGDAVRSHLLRVVVEDRHARTSPPARGRRRGRRTTGSAMSRSAVVTRGTDEVTAMPVTTSATSMPSRSSSCDSSSACSSGVRSSTVDSRQWCDRPAGSGGTGGARRLPGGGSSSVAGAEEPDHRLGVPHVDGQQHGVSPPRGGPMRAPLIVGAGPDRRPPGRDRGRGRVPSG